MHDILIMATVIAPVTSGVVEVIKRATNLNRRFLPASAVLLGMGLGSVAFFFDAELGQRIWAGGISGLAATGLFELGKKANGGE